MVPHVMAASPAHGCTAHRAVRSTAPLTGLLARTSCGGGEEGSGRECVTDTERKRGQTGTWPKDLNSASKNMTMTQPVEVDLVSRKLAAAPQSPT